MSDLPSKGISHMNLGKVFIVSGPAGVGKTTVCGRLLRECPDSLRRIITATTRNPRIGEVDGVDYNFIDETTFLKYIAEDKFLEYANVHKKYYYGTPISQVLSNMKRGINSLLIVDVQGVINIKKRYPVLAPQIVTIFIMPENLQVLSERLTGRNSEKSADVGYRLASAVNEMKFSKRYDYVMVSGSREEDFQSLRWIYQLESGKKSDALQLTNFRNRFLKLSHAL